MRRSAGTLRDVHRAAIAGACVAFAALALSARAQVPVESLRVAKDASPPAVVLTWTGPGPQFEVFRATRPQGIVQPANSQGIVAGTSWPDPAPPSALLTCYNVQSRCVTPSAETCNGLDDDCNGRVDETFDLQSDPGNCGSCGRVCVFNNGTGACALGECVIAACDPGWGDVNGDPADGCEFACQPLGSDRPDDLFQDIDCDGVDGNTPRSIFVAGDVGDDANPGTMAFPMRTVSAGIARAAGTGFDVLVSKGIYDETVVLLSGVSTFGAYDRADGWRRASDHLTVIAGRSTTVLADGVVSATLDWFTLRPDDAAQPGESSHGVRGRASTALTLSNLTVIAADGADGGAGSSGAMGSGGAAGAAGTPGCEDSGFGCTSCARPAPGAGGGSPCGQDGGRGGWPGHASGGGEPGLAGAGGAVGGAGGQGNGANCGTAGDGDPGQAGARGANGSAGAGGDQLGDVTDGGYVPDIAGMGSSGSAGGGGAGGGGGGGGVAQCDSYGSSGGGGGGGGCGGSAGAGGQGGGGSFGLYFFDCSASLRAITVLGGRGGNGGPGGSPGSGGSGGAFGAGGPYGGGTEQDDGSCGGTGGRGGDGGNGGAGGGGGGGPSLCLVSGGASSVTMSAVTLVPGAAGAGGPSAGQPGADGLAAPSWP